MIPYSRPKRSELYTPILEKTAWKPYPSQRHIPIQPIYGSAPPARSPVQIIGDNWDKLERGQRPYHTHTHTTEWYDPFELLKTPTNPRNWSKIPIFQNRSIFAKYNTCNNISTEFIYGGMAAYLKRPAFVPEEGNSLLWSIETLSVPWIVVVHTNSIGNGL